MKVVVTWTLALVAVVGAGVGAETIVGVARPALELGSVTRLFSMVGGPSLDGGFRDYHGAVYLYPASSCSSGDDPTCTGRPAAAGRAARDGRFSLKAPAGTYVLVGSTSSDGGPPFVAAGGGLVGVWPDSTTIDNINVVSA